MILKLEKSLFNEEFSRDFATLLNNSTKTFTTPKEDILSRTPANISYEVIANLIQYLLSPGIDNASEETPVLDAVTPDEALELLNCLMEISNDIVNKYGNDILMNFLDGYSNLVNASNKKFCALSYSYAVYILIITHKLLLGLLVYEINEVKL